MNIIAPIRNADQYDTLVSSGAEELFGGVLDHDWSGQYGSMIEYNRRGNFSAQANFADYDALGEVVCRANRDHIPFYLTANAIGVVDSQIPALRQILRRYRQVGGRKVIVGNYLSLRLALEEGCQVTVSSCAGIYNRGTARFWQDAGAERLIFPRAVSLDTIRAIRKECGPEMELEVFMMNSGCKFSDSMCRSLHNTQFGALCAYVDKRRKSYLDMDGAEITGYDAAAMENSGFFYRQLYTGNCSMGCGQCAMWDLAQAGIDSLKIVGRLMPTQTVAGCIRLTKKNSLIAEAAASREEYMAAMVSPETELQMQLCRNHTSCYYRE